MKKLLVLAAVAALAFPLFAQGFGAAKPSDADLLLGSFRPAVHTKLCDELKLGKDATKIVKRLKTLSIAKGDEGSQAEALAILQALEQSKTNLLEMATALCESDPLAAAGLAQAASKTFPQDKKLYKPILDKMSTNPAVAQAWKEYQKLMAYKDGIPESKAERQKAYKAVLAAEVKCNAAKKMLGERMPPALVKLDAFVAELKGALEAAGMGKKK